MKTKVVVTLRGEIDVEIEVEHAEDEDPTDLTPQDESRARGMAFMSGDVEWDVEKAERAP